MKNIILISLTLRNFKGITDLSVEFGKETNIFGANESGKSTICTAFYWLLTGKDEFDRKDYEIKNTSRKELNSQSHEVEGTFIVDGREVKLKRAYLEKWVKKRGQSQREFEGHQNEFYVNDTPCATAGEFQDRVNEIIPAEILKLITNPLYFNSLKPEDQRRGLLKIAGEITTEDIISSISDHGRDFTKLLAVITNGDKLEDYKKRLAAKRNDLKKSAVEYGPKIEELTRTMPEGKDWPVIQSEINTLRTEYTSIDDIISNHQKALSEKQRGITNLRNQVFEKESQITSIREKIKQETQHQHNLGSNKVELGKKALAYAEAGVKEGEDAIVDRNKKIEKLKQEIAQADQKIAQHKAAWDKINSEKFEFDEEACKCPTCKQSLPDSDVEEQKEALRKNFNESVLKRKAAEVAGANSAKESKKSAEDKIGAIETEITSLHTSLATLEDKATELRTQLSLLEDAEKNKPAFDLDAAVSILMDKNADALNLQDEISELQKEITSATAALGEQPSFDTEKARKQEILSKVDDLNKILGLKETIEKMTARIEQLHKEESATAQAIADIEQEEFNLESFLRAKMDILESRVNEMFKYVKFRLFEKQVNGGIADTCICEYNGVPFGTLNTAARIWAGIDVVNTFSKHFGISAPIFIDNRESITLIPDTESQVVSLIVSPADKSLRLESVSENQTLFA